MHKHELQNKTLKNRSFIGGAYRPRINTDATNQEHAAGSRDTQGLMGSVRGELRCNLYETKISYLDTSIQFF